MPPAFLRSRCIYIYQNPIVIDSRVRSAGEFSLARRYGFLVSFSFWLLLARAFRADARRCVYMRGGKVAGAAAGWVRERGRLVSNFNRGVVYKRV